MTIPDTLGAKIVSTAPVVVRRAIRFLVTGDQPTVTNNHPTTIIPSLCTAIAFTLLPKLGSPKVVSTIHVLVRRAREPLVTPPIVENAHHTITFPSD